MIFQPIQVVTTVPDEDAAERIAQALVTGRLAACVQVSGPITSTYRWQGAVETSQEWVCSVKTERAKFEAVEQAIRRLHPYDVPEIVATPIVVGSNSYLVWLEGALGPDESGGTD
jgi:periplasmic divalent cation tolerance protein